MQYRERVIFIGQHIDEEFSNQILATMLYLDSIDNSKKLYMYINGPGGDVSSWWTSLLQLNPATFSIFLLLVTPFSLAKGLLFLQLTPSMSIFDTMQSLQSPVGTHCVGYAYNLAAFLLAAGEKVIIFSSRVWNGSVNAGELDLLYSDFDQCSQCWIMVDSSFLFLLFCCISCGLSSFI